MTNYLHQRQEQKLGIRKTDQQERQEKKRVPVKKVSDKRKEENKEYEKKRKAYVKSHPNCEAQIVDSCRKKSQDIHHKRGRKTKDDRLNEEHWLPICRPCHIYITAHPAVAYELGLSEKTNTI